MHAPQTVGQQSLPSGEVLADRGAGLFVLVGLGECAPAGGAVEMAMLIVTPPRLTSMSTPDRSSPYPVMSGAKPMGRSLLSALGSAGMSLPGDRYISWMVSAASLCRPPRPSRARVPVGQHLAFERLAARVVETRTQSLHFVFEQHEL